MFAGMPLAQLREYLPERAEVYDVTFAGFGGRPIKSRLLLTRHAERRKTCVAEYQAHSGGHVLQSGDVALQGMAHQGRDTRSMEKITRAEKSSSDPGRLAWRT